MSEVNNPNPIWNFKYWLIDQNSSIWQQMHDPIKTRETERQTILTASQIANIFGYGFETRLKYYNKLICNMKLEENKPEINDYFKEKAITHGKENEWLAKESFRSLFPSIKITTPGMIFHRHFNFIAASLDAVGLDVNNNELVVVETKCPFRARPTAVWDIKENYLIQITVQMACVDLKVAYLHYWWEDETTDEPRYITFKIPFDETFWNYIIAGATNFKQNVDFRQSVPLRQKKDERLIVIIDNLRTNIKVVDRK